MKKIFSILLNLLSSTFRKKGIIIKKVKDNEKILENVFNKNFSKNVLISYLTSPFTHEIKISHSNQTECYIAAEIFDKLGYNVDVINFDNDTNIDFSKYSIVYGLALPLEKSFLAKNRDKLLKIFYSTGANHFFYFKVATNEVFKFKKKTGLLIPESARVEGTTTILQNICADAVIAVGNEDCKNTFTDINSEIDCYYNNLFYFDTYDINIDNKDFYKNRKHFIWFGSGGLISKGLWHCLDIFINRDDIVLHICGASQIEKKFWEYYNPLIKDKTNIINHGFVKMDSELFKELMDKCTFVIFPSISEGGSPALINIMANGGLIPIASEKNIALSINQYGFGLNTINTEEIEKMIDIAVGSDPEKLKLLSKRIKKETREKYTIEKYKINLDKIITDILRKNNRL